MTETAYVVLWLLSGGLSAALWRGLLVSDKPLTRGGLIGLGIFSLAGPFPLFAAMVLLGGAFIFVTVNQAFGGDEKLPGTWLSRPVIGPAKATASSLPQPEKEKE